MTTREERTLSVLRALVPALPMLAGYFAGRSLGYDGCGALVILSLLGGLFLAVAGLFVWMSPGTHPLSERLSALALMAYGAVLLTAEHVRGFSLFESASGENILGAVAWLIPLFIGAQVAPGEDRGRARWGWWLILFAGVAVVTYDTVHTYSHVGFLYVAYF